MNLRQHLLLEQKVDFLSEYFGMSIEKAEMIDKRMIEFNGQINLYANSLYIGDGEEEIPYRNLPDGFAETLVDVMDNEFSDLSVIAKGIIWNHYLQQFALHVHNTVQQRRTDKIMRRHGLGVFLDARDAFKKQQLQKRMDEDAQNDLNDTN